MGWWSKKTQVLSPLEGYNRWASTYSQESNPIKNLSDELVTRFLPDLKGKTVLDAGCGTGKFCALAEQQNASLVTGLDLSPAMIAEAEKLCAKTFFQCIDLSKESPEGTAYDVIICALVMGHIESLTPALSNLLLTLRKGGQLILTDFHPFLTMLQSKRTFNDNTTGKVFEIRHHLHLFESYFKIFQQHGVIVEQLEEPGYQDNPVVFGLRARKHI
jgi:malonyl-CoA O-methyltransferase